ncbi:MAG: DUF1648 domain-containing protein [Tissierellia bacterium]|jgi:uncharacterized membrane protein|nr:DUF1648 domain-containing protein [Tissierellia bacterium]
MKNKIRFTKESKLSVLASIIIGVAFYTLFYNKMPDIIPTHWNFSGEIDGYSEKFNAFVLIPAGMVGANIFLNFMLDNDPKNRTQKNKAITIGKISMPVILLFILTIQTIFGLGREVKVNLLVDILMGVLFIAIGNYLPKAKRNYVVGIKVPWTLNSDENWNRTHRFGGVVYIIGGFLFIINSFINSSIIVFLTIGALFLPIIYSFYLYTKGI